MDANTTHAPIICRCCGQVIENAVYDRGAAESRVLYPLKECPKCKGRL